MPARTASNLNACGLSGGWIGYSFDVGCKHYDIVNGMSGLGFGNLIKVDKLDFRHHVKETVMIF